MYDPVKDGVAKSFESVVYTEVAPPAHLGQLVHCFWEMRTKTDLAEDFTLHAMPDACVNVLFNQQDTRRPAIGRDEPGGGQLRFRRQAAGTALVPPGLSGVFCGPVALHPFVPEADRLHARPVQQDVRCLIFTIFSKRFALQWFWKAHGLHTHRKETLMRKVGWFDIYVEDMERAQTFYETVLNTKLSPMDDPKARIWAVGSLVELHQRAASAVRDEVVAETPSQARAARWSTFPATIALWKKPGWWQPAA